MTSILQLLWFTHGRKATSHSVDCVVYFSSLSNQLTPYSSTLQKIPKAVKKIFFFIVPRNNLLLIALPCLNLFCFSEYLQTSADTRLAARDSSTFLQDKYIYVSGINGKLHAISTDVAEIANTATSNFTEQACMVFMGK